MKMLVRLFVCVLLISIALPHSVFANPKNISAQCEKYENKSELIVSSCENQQKHSKPKLRQRILSKWLSKKLKKHPQLLAPDDENKNSVCFLLGLGVLLALIAFLLALIGANMVPALIIGAAGLIVCLLALGRINEGSGKLLGIIGVLISLATIVLALRSIF